jgi:hypothetical protein
MQRLDLSGTCNSEWIGIRPTSSSGQTLQMDALGELTSLVISRPIIVADLLPRLVLFQYLQADIAGSWLPLYSRTRLVVQDIEQWTENWEAV